MMERECLSLSCAGEKRLKDALAALIASTRRGKRKLTLVALAKKLRIATQLLGSLHAVAQAIDLSEEMVRQFARVEKLSLSVRRLAASGDLSSVDLADRLSRLPADDQLPVAKGVLSGELNPGDVRAILALRKTTPQAPIAVVIDRIKRSRNIKEFIAEFVAPKPFVGRDAIMERLSSTLGCGHVKRLEVEKGVGRITIDANGKRTLEQGARKARLTKGNFLRRIVCGEVV